MRWRSLRGLSRCTPTPGRGDVRGFTAVELLLVLAVLAALATGYMALQRPPEMHGVEVAARRLAGEIERARDQAVAAEGEALVAVVPDGRFAARAGAVGTLALESTPAGEWEALPEGVAWGAGDAARDPLDRPVRPLPAQVFCDADGSCAPPAPAAVYLLRSIRESHRVAAVTLEAGGTVQTWRWVRGSGAWTPSAR